MHSTFAFVVGFTAFLTNCIDYHKVRGSKSLDEILIPKCTSRFSGSATFLLWLFSFFWIGKLFQYILDIRRLMHMHDFSTTYLVSLMRRFRRSRGKRWSVA